MKYKKIKKPKKSQQNTDYANHSKSEHFTPYNITATPPMTTYAPLSCRTKPSCMTLLLERKNLDYQNDIGSQTATSIQHVLSIILLSLWSFVQQTRTVRCMTYKKIK